ncbi:MAG: HAMP domain-containing protein [Synechococcaceae cyanobacterium SM1_2_3]|nr:HAMP domain-containing protein [Synechococcaceae cyanobacterium SM1_2_3]
MLNNLKLGAKLGLGFGLSVVITIVVGWVASSHLKQLSGLTEELYEHPFTVSVSVLEIQGAVTRIHRSMKDVALAQDAEQINKAATEVTQEEAPTLKFFDVLQERFAGDKSEITKARQLFVAWKPIREETIALMRAGKQAEAAQNTKNKAATHIQELNQSLEKIKTASERNAEEFVAQAQRERDQAMILTYLTIVIGVIFAILAAFLITRSITHRLKKVINVTHQVAEGNLTVDIAVDAGDELGNCNRRCRP